MFAIAPTDYGWFTVKRDEFRGRLANFWTPTPWAIGRLKPGDRLYFLLRSPIRKVAGYGLFRAYGDADAETAWDRYGIGNGVHSEAELRGKIVSFLAVRKRIAAGGGEPTIGCIELADLVLLTDDAFVDPNAVGHAFPTQVVKYKYFDGMDRLAEAIGVPTRSGDFELVTGSSRRVRTTRKDRPGRSAFRQMILRNYDLRCCITGEQIVELLEASHIQPYIDVRSDHPQNGICLRVDLHRLFDDGLLSIDPALKLRTSPKLAGTGYEKLDGTNIRPPATASNHPSIKALAEHHKHVFR